jgi:diaminopimelate epimerase
MHGTGNDYVYVNCFREKVETPEQLAKHVSDRHKGIGSDGLVLIMPSDKADFRMRMFNPDGSEAQMCGNASRCVGKYVYDYRLTDKTEISLETKAGIKYLQLFPDKAEKIQQVRVNMGEPILEAASIPVNVSLFPGLKDNDRIINREIDFSPEKLRITCVSMGNPHCVIFTKQIDNMDIETIGRKIEHAAFFPEKINVEFAEIVSPGKVKMRVWERGTGETQACGTGACAVMIAGVLNNLTGRNAEINLLGGDLQIEWKETDNQIYMTGNAVTVFEGEIPISSKEWKVGSSNSQSFILNPQSSIF